MLKNQHAIHHLKLVDEMCKFEMDMAIVVKIRSGHDLVYIQTAAGRPKWNQHGKVVVVVITKLSL